MEYKIANMNNAIAIYIWYNDFFVIKNNIYLR